MYPGLPLICNRHTNNADFEAEQEEKILNLLLANKSNKEIAEVLFVSVSTVKTHVNNVYKKLNVQSRNEVIALFNK